MKKKNALISRWAGDLQGIYTGLSSERTKVMFMYSMLGACVIGLAAHAFAYFNFAPIHDTVNYVDNLAGGWEVSLGRFFQPIYGRIRGEYLMPWMSGMLSMLYIGLASFLLNDLFDVDEPWMAFLTAGFLSANATTTNVTLAFSYVTDVFALSLLLAVAGAYVTIRLRAGLGVVLGSLFFVASMGLYQSYVILGGVVIVSYVVLQALCEKHVFRREAWNWAGYVCTVVMTALVYWLVYRYFLWSYGTEMASSGSYNSPARLASMRIADLVPVFKEAYGSFLEYFWGIGCGKLNLIQSGTLLLCLITFVLTVVYAVKTKLPLMNACLILAAAALFPGMAQVISVLSGKGRTYFLTAHALFILYPLLLGVLNKIRFTGKRENAIDPIKTGVFKTCILLVCSVILFGNIRFSNEIYAFRTVQYDKTVSYVTRLMERIDSVPGYVRNETEVVFSGYLSAKLSNTTEPEGSHWMVGINNSAITYLQVLREFIHLLGENMNIPGDYSKLPDYAGMEEVRAMPAFPAPGCAAMIDGRVLVKLSD